MLSFGCHLFDPSTDVGAKPCCRSARDSPALNVTAVRRCRRGPPSGIPECQRFTMRSTLFALRCWTLGGVCFVSALSAQPPSGRYDPSTYVHTSADIPMRDGL